MAPKKSAFFTFLTHYRDDEIKKGKTPSSYKQLSINLSPIWNDMTDGEKNKYRVLANKCISNTNGNKKQPLNYISNGEEVERAVCNMEKLVAEMFENIPNDRELFNKKFILLHINCHSSDEELYYFPAEIAAIEFDFKNGLSRTYHQIIGISKLKRPNGYPGYMRTYSNIYHLIDCLDEHPDDYQNIFFEFLTFLKDGIINKTDVGEGTLDLPYLYTLESSKDEYNIRKTINSLERLYSTAFPEVNAELVKSTFKIAKADQLLVEIKKKMNLPLDEWNYDGVNVEVGEINYFVSILEYNYYIDYICCKYHETRYNRINVKCSKSRVIRWMVNIFDHINTYTDLNLIPGRHVATTLRDGSSLMIENAHLPLTAAELNLNRNTSYDDNILPNSIISP